jgi:hypothetical protein
VGLVLWGRYRGAQRVVAAAPAPGPDAPTTPLGPSWT